MNLRSFHLLFITLSTLLAGFLAAWALHRYTLERTTADAAIGVLSIVAAVGLATYGIVFRRRSRHLS